MDIVEEYAELEFDEEKYYLGTLCRRGHDWNRTGHSLKYNSNDTCVECKKDYRLGIITANDYVEYINLKCAYCGDLIKLKKSVYSYRIKQGAKRTFCSKKCSNRYYAEKRKSKEKKFCVTCGKEYFNKNLKYCCKDCANKGIENKIELVCEVCGESYFVCKSKASRSKTCCVDCRIVYVTTNNRKSIYTKEDSQKRQLDVKRRSRIRRYHFKEALKKANDTSNEEERREILSLVEGAVDNYIMVLDTEKLIKRRSNVTGREDL